MADVSAWLAAASLGEGPVLRRVYKTWAGDRQLWPENVNRRISEMAVAAGLEPEVVRRLTSHSFRVGAAQDLAASGRTLLEIMRAGRWRYVGSVSHYVREADINVWSEPEDESS
jgi:hypothetical protein